MDLVGALFVGTILLLYTVFVGVLMPLVYLAGAGHGVLAKHHGNKSEDGPTLMWSIGFFFSMMLILGMSIVGEHYAVPLETRYLMLGLTLCISLATVMVIIGTKMATHLFHHDVRFEHWWSTAITSVGPKKPSMWWSWF